MESNRFSIKNVNVCATMEFHQILKPGPL